MSLASYEWRNGAPKADNPRQARQMWAPYLAEWGALLQHRFWWEVTTEPGHVRLGWIDDAPFWRSLWHGFSQHAQHVDRYSQMLRIGPLLQEAGKIGNMVPFQAIGPVDSPAYALLELALESVTQDDVLLARSVVEWFDALNLEHLPAGQASRLAQRQDYSWSRVAWKFQSYASPLVRRHISPLELEDVLAIAAPVLLARPEAPFVQIHVLGHLMANAPGSWFRSTETRPGLLAHLSQRFDGLLHPSVDLGLIALCSGHGPNSSELHKSIKALGRHFMAGETSAEGKLLRAPELNAVRNLYDLRDAYDLYEVLSATRLGTQKSLDTAQLSLDGLLDGPA